jgi:hypothetical protein
VNECKPLPRTVHFLRKLMVWMKRRHVFRWKSTPLKTGSPTLLLLSSTRGLHSSTFQLNLSALYRIGGGRRGYVARVKGV